MKMPDFSFVLWGLLFVAALVVMLIKKEFRESAEAVMLFEYENVPPFFWRLSSIFDAGFKVSDIHHIQSEIEEMSDNEVKELGTYSVQFRGRKMRICIKAEVHLDHEEDNKEIMLIFSSQPELVQAIQQVMRRFAAEYGLYGAE